MQPQQMTPSQPLDRRRWFFHEQAAAAGLRLTATAGIRASSPSLQGAVERDIMFSIKTGAAERDHETVVRRMACRAAICGRGDIRLDDNRPGADAGARPCPGPD
jgi:hypothetical protein